MIGREVGDDLTAVLGHDDLFLDAGGTRPVLGPFPCLKSKNHALLERLVLATEAFGEDRPLPKRKANAVTILKQSLTVAYSL